MISSQIALSYLPPGSALLSRLFSSIIFPCHPDTAHVLDATQISLRIRKWKESVWSRAGLERQTTPCSVEGCGSNYIVARFSAIHRSWRTRRQVDTLASPSGSTSIADQATTSETLNVSHATTASNFTEGTSTESPSATASSSSSAGEESTKSPSPPNATFASGVETSAAGSITGPPAGITSETAPSAPTADSRVTYSISVATAGDPTFPSVPPLSPSAIEATLTSPSLSPTTSPEARTPDPGVPSRSSTQSLPSTPDPQASSSSSWGSTWTSWVDEGGSATVTSMSIDILPSSTSSIEATSTTTDSNATTLPPVNLPSSFTSDPPSIPVTTVTALSFSTTSETATSVIIVPWPSSPSVSSSLTLSSPSPISSTSPGFSSSDSFSTIESTPSSSTSDTSSTSDRRSSSRSSRVTFTTTEVWTGTLTDGSTSTFSTVIETGVLSTDTPKESGFAHNTGAIIGVSLSATFVLILLVVVIFFACKRYKSKLSSNGSTDNILAVTHNAPWRPPLGGDDDESSLQGYGRAHSPPYLNPSSSQGHGGYDEYVGPGGGSAGDHLSGEGVGYGSAESANVGMAPPMNPMFGGQPYMPDIDQRYSTADDQDVWWGSNDPQALYTGSRAPTLTKRRVSAGGSRSAISLKLGDESSSSGEHAGSSSSGEGLRRGNTKHSSISGPRPMPARDGRRHTFTPPSAFLGTRDFNVDHERQQPDQSDKTSVKSFLSRLRNGRGTSMQSVVTVKGGAQPEESFMTSVHTNLYSPSLLNPPIPLPPPRPLLHFPPGVTGNSYFPSQQMTYTPHDTISAVLWPPVTLPPLPSPVPTDDSSMIAGLLHPRLGMGLDLAQQESTTSLRDHEDYTRPINGLVNNHLRSTTTFDTHDTTESEDGRQVFG